MEDTKTITLKTTDIIDGVLRSIEANLEYFGVAWPYPVDMSETLLFNLLLAHAKEVTHKALTTVVRREYVNYLELFMKDNFPKWNEELRKVFTRTYMDLAGAEWHNRLTENVSLCSFEVWSVDAIDDCIILHYVGDYRVLDWERQHIHEGVYYPDGVPADIEDIEEESLESTVMEVIEKDKRKPRLYRNRSYTREFMPPRSGYLGSN